MTRPFRFGVSVPGALDGARWRDLARRVEASGFDTLLVPDHLAPRMLSALPAVTSALEATSTLRAGTLVLNNDLRHPIIVARDAATIHLLSNGRFELGIGAGYGRAAVTAAGLAYATSQRRIERLEESVQLIRRVWGGDPVWFEGTHYRMAGHECALIRDGAPIPILVGGNSWGTLGVAAHHADSIGFIGVSQSEHDDTLRPTHITHAGLGEQVAFVRELAGDRFGDRELSILVQQVTITRDRVAAADDIQTWLPAKTEEILDSPYFFLGSAQAIADQVRRLREELGISYLTVLGSSMSAMERVVDDLR